MFCQNCGKEIPEGNRSCNYCGHKAPPPNNSTSNNSPKSLGFWQTMQDTVKGVGEAWDKAVEEGKKKEKEKEKEIKKIDSRFKIEQVTNNFIDVNLFIIVDTFTGVNYLFAEQLNSCGGLTVLVDNDGKPIVTK